MPQTAFRRAVATALLTVLALPALPAPARAAGAELTLQQIMANADWIGNPPQNPYWADDGKSLYFERKRQGSELRDLYHLSLSGGTPERVAPEKKSAVDAPGGELSTDRTLKVYERAGDLFVKDLKSGTIRQLTRTAAAESSPRFLWKSRRVSYQVDNTWFVYDLDSGLVSQVADLKLAKDPADKKPEGFLEEQQLRLMDVLKEKKAKADAKRESEQADQKADPARPPLPFYLGDKVEIANAVLSPRADRLLVVTRPKDGGDRKRDVMPRWVTESGYVEPEPVRAKVGDPKEPSIVPNQAVLLDLPGHRQLPLDLSVLPGLADDPLKEIRERAEAKKKERDEAREATDKKKVVESAGGAKDGKAADGADAAKKDDAKEPAKPKPRDVQVSDAIWSDDGSRLALRVDTFDNKDRWVATVDLDKGAVHPRHRISDPAWVSWDLTAVGWLRDNATLYYLSEESGYSHLYLASDKDGAERALTRGKYEVSQVQRDRGGRYLYYIANETHPGIHQVYRVDVANGKSEALTALGGEVDGFVVSPDEARLAIIHSNVVNPPELFVQDNRSGQKAHQLTRSVSDTFAGFEWIRPEVVPIASSHGAGGPIYTRVYVPDGFDAKRADPYPAAIFIHGAGYLQNAHLGWSTYFREFMFNNLLARHGYVVLDYDYRGSAGYGRDWRTAIYRQMGYPEIEDLEDVIAWVGKERNVDVARVGAFGGSYGGFLTLMALFRKPDLLAAGAALRPVTDWAHYNHPYTAAILNTPEVDPDAYDKSSPIEYAAGLKKPLLICSGMVDDNVFFQDSVRLAQRLIELEKENWTFAPYPVEPHGFREPSSWLDEYRRIYKLFETEVKGSRP
jgi:dipeptidyl aminopeptidase/acylaminoacyl peptidase